MLLLTALNLSGVGGAQVRIAAQENSEGCHDKVSGRDRELARLWLRVLFGLGHTHPRTSALRLFLVRTLLQFRRSVTCVVAALCLVRCP